MRGTNARLPARARGAETHPVADACRAPIPDEALDRLHQAGGSVGDVGRLDRRWAQLVRHRHECFKAPETLFQYFPFGAFAVEARQGYNKLLHHGMIH
jgi:hypothetical protein